MAKSVIFRDQQIRNGDVVCIGNTYREWGIVVNVSKIKNWQTGKDLKLILNNGKERKSVFLNSKDYSHDHLQIYKKSGEFMKELNSVESGYWRNLMR